jgi:hypothetical protein
MQIKRPAGFTHPGGHSPIPSENDLLPPPLPSRFKAHIYPSKLQKRRKNLAFSQFFYLNVKSELLKDSFLLPQYTTPTASKMPVYHQPVTKVLVSRFFFFFLNLDKVSLSCPGWPPTPGLKRSSYLSLPNSWDFRWAP